MAEDKVAWRLKGKWLKNCNCAPGCPCDFWATPTHHKCEGMIAMEVDEGHFGDIKMDGVKFAVTYHWPGPLHKGNGTVQSFVDEKTSPEQRDAILKILSGQAGNAWFEVVMSVVSKVLKPKFVPIEFRFDLAKRHATVVIPGILETITEPMKNLATGGEHQIRVQLPNGMEYKIAEIATAVMNKGIGEIKYDCPSGHSSLAYVEQTHEGLKG